MTTKEKVIRESMALINKELAEINYILNANPLIDIIELRKTSIGKAKQMKPGEEVIKYLNEKIKEEKKLFELAKKQENSIELIDRKVKLEMEYSNLRSELYFIENINKL